MIYMRRTKPRVLKKWSLAIYSLYRSRVGAMGNYMTRRQCLVLSEASRLRSSPAPRSVSRVFAVFSGLAVALPPDWSSRYIIIVIFASFRMLQAHEPK